MAQGTRAGWSSEERDGRRRWTHLVRRAASGRIAAAAGPAVAKEHEGLAAELAEAVAGEVGFDAGTRALYATDASNYRQVPIGVVVPRSAEEVAAAVAVCRRHDVPLLPRGGGTGLNGQTCNVAVVIDFSRHLDHVLSVDLERRLAVVEPGCILDTLRDAAERSHLTLGPDPATHDHNTLGGMIGNNSCGVHSVMAGRTSDNVEALEVLTYDGLRMRVGRTSEEELSAILAGGGRRAKIYRRLDEFRRKYGELIRARYPRIPRRVSGYENLDELLPENGFNVARALVGTEGTCVTVLEATLNLVPSPPARVLVIAGFPDIFEAADAVPRVLEHGPIGLEGVDDLLVKYVKQKHLHEEDVELLPDGDGWLVVEFGGEDEAEAVEKADGLVRALGGEESRARVVSGERKQARIWRLREQALGATALVPGQPDTWEGWEDSAVPREALGDYLREFKALLHRHGYESAVYGHFGDGLVHCRINFDLRTEEGLRNWQGFLDEAAELVVRHGGSLSGEHGDGQAKADLLGKMYGPELLQAFREFKAIWDPDGKMNPGKVVDPFPITSNLRLGPGYRPPEVETVFAFPNDEGRFAHATQRCVGVGKCRRLGSDEGGVMCPSYMVTREERHSTRGRARLLFEMLHGGPIQDGWKSDAVEDALSLCLACKGCKSDCPVNVDMATYKAEFRAHYYEGRLRPRAAYSMGLIQMWSRAAGAVPGLANFATQTPGLSAVVKWAGGIAQERQMPRYAGETFRRWFARRQRDGQGSGRSVVLWPDTFNNHFRPQTAIAATRVLEAAGFEITIPPRVLCCGRPLYDWGMLERAKRLWRETLDSLRPEIEAGTPLVGLEPACLAAFRDELPNLFPGDPLAQRLSRQSLFLTEFLDQHAGDGRLPKTDGKALVHIHCHQHAVIGTDAEKKVLDRLGLDHRIVSSGCCGMAGAFGFEADKVEVSKQAGERILLPEVRRADEGTRIVTNGFSCREQIEQGTGRPTVHVAELIAGALGTRLDQTGQHRVPATPSRE